MQQRSSLPLYYHMIMFVKYRWGEDFEGVIWYPTLGNGLIKVTGQIDANGVVTFSEDEVISGEGTDQGQGVVAGARYTAKLGKMTLTGSGKFIDPKTKAVFTLKFFMKLAH